MKFCITGSKGFIGSNFIKLIKKKNFSYKSITSNSLYRLSGKKKIKGFTHFLHLSFKRKKTKKNHLENIKQLKIILEKICQETKLIFISSIGVLNKKHEKYSYYHSKKLCEKEILRKSKNFLIIRFPNVYGYGQKGNFLIPSIVKKLKKKNRILLDNYQDKRDYLHIEDAINLINLLAYKKNKIINVNSKNKFTVLQVYKKIIKLLAIKRKFYLMNKNSKLKNAFTSKKNIDLLTNYKFINLENGLKKTMKI